MWLHFRSTGYNFGFVQISLHRIILFSIYVAYLNGLLIRIVWLPASFLTKGHLTFLITDKSYKVIVFNFLPSSNMTDFHWGGTWFESYPGVISVFSMSLSRQMLIYLLFQWPSCSVYSNRCSWYSMIIMKSHNLKIVRLRILMALRLQLSAACLCVAGR